MNAYVSSSTPSSTTRRSLLACILAIVVLTLALSPMATLAVVAPTPTPVSTTTPSIIRGGVGDQHHPHVSGTLVSYTDKRESSSEIRYLDLTTGSADDRAISTGGNFDSLSDVSGTTIVFERRYADVYNTARPILAFDTAHPEFGAVELAPVDGARRTFPSIGDRTVAWMDQVEGSSTFDIVAYDLGTGLTTRLTTDGATMINRYPQVSGDGMTITWEKCAVSNACDIYVSQKQADGTWGIRIQLSDSTGNDIQPDTDGQIVAYTSTAGTDYTNYDIWWENVDGTNERRLEMPGVQANPKIMGNLIMFESEVDGHSTRDLYAYDITSDTLYQITNTPDVIESLSNGAVDADGTVRVVWGQPDGITLGHNDVWTLSFPLPGSTSTEICPLFDQARSYRLKSTVPIRLQLCDAQGQNLSSPSLVLTATGLVKLDGTASTAIVEDAGNANPDNNFRYDETIAGYTYNLSTKDLSTGTWELRFTVSGDPTSYSITFDLG